MTPEALGRQIYDVRRGLMTKRGQGHSPVSWNKLPLPSRIASIREAETLMARINALAASPPKDDDDLVARCIAIAVPPL